MALAEQISRKIHKFGLIPKFIKFIPTLSAIFALGSVLWLLVLPLEGQYRTTYISENALMPAQVNSYFRESEWNIVRGYRQEVKDFSHWNQTERNAVLEGWLKDIGLKTSYHGDTLYAIMHAPRGDHTESMVVAVPWTTSDLHFNQGGVALAAALARYWAKMSIWSKNIIFVFPKDGHVALRSWVEGYHTSLDFVTAGSIDAAIVMEFGGSSDYFQWYEIGYEGINGQLPNLDLMNTANLVGFHEGLKYSIQGTHYDDIDKNTYVLRLKTFLSGIVRLALTGLITPTLGCEAFSGWQIQAITLKAKGVDGSPDITQFGRIVDSSLRSVNNLLEKFHQSFFFYLMLSPKYFVSIGTYLPSACLIAASFAVSALGCILNSEVMGPNDDTSIFFNEVGSLLSYFTGIEAFCYVLSVVLPFLTKIAGKSGKMEELQTTTFILYGFTLFTSVFSVLPFFNKSARKFFKLSKPVTYSLTAFALLYIAMLIFALLIIHFTLALSIGLLALPLTWIQPIITSSITQIPITEEVEETKKSNLSEPEKVAILPAPGAKDPLSNFVPFVANNKPILKIILCLFCSSPFFIIYIIANFFYEEDGGVVLLMRGLLTSWDELQCWTWFVIILGWFPAWLSIAFCCTFGDFEPQYVKLKTQ